MIAYQHWVYHSISNTTGKNTKMKKTSYWKWHHQSVKQIMNITSFPSWLPILRKAIFFTEEFHIRPNMAMLKSVGGIKLFYLNDRKRKIQEWSFVRTGYIKAGNHFEKKVSNSFNQYKIVFIKLISMLNKNQFLCLLDPILCSYLT